MVEAEEVSMGERSESKPGTVAAAMVRETLDELREQVLGYDPASDKGGAIWDGLRVEVDRKIAVARTAVDALERRAVPAGFEKHVEALAARTPSEG